MSHAVNGRKDDGVTMGRHAKAFTLAELLVSLMVTSIILSAVATLAFALSSASRAGEDYAHTQARIRHATIYFTDLIGRCRLICAAPANDLVVWRADDNDDGRINVNELVYIERGEGLNRLRLCQFSSIDNPEIALADLSLSGTKMQLVYNHAPRYVTLIPDCSNAQFGYFGVHPPRTGWLAITFGIMEGPESHRYEIVATVRGRAAHLLNAAGTAIVETDDD